MADWFAQKGSVTPTIATLPFPDTKYRVIEGEISSAVYIPAALAGVPRGTEFSLPTPVTCMDCMGWNCKQSEW